MKKKTEFTLSNKKYTKLIKINELVKIVFFSLSKQENLSVRVQEHCEKETKLLCHDIPCDSKVAFETVPSYSCLFFRDWRSQSETNHVI